MNLDKHSLVMISDGDSLPYLLAWNHRDNEDVDAILKATDSFVQTLLDNTSCTHYIGFLGGSKQTFRNFISPTYKAHRPPSPDWYKKWAFVIKAHLRDAWKFQVVTNIEADDAVSIASEELKRLDINHILVHADKDIRQKSGNHYNLRTHQREYISEEEATRNLYTQILVGDVADGFKGCEGVGKVKAARYLSGLTTPSEMSDICQTLFENKYGLEEGTRLFFETSSLALLLLESQPYTTLSLDYIPVSRPDIPNADMEAIIADIWE